MGEKGMNPLQKRILVWGLGKFVLTGMGIATGVLLLYLGSLWLEYWGIPFLEDACWIVRNPASWRYTEFCMSEVVPVWLTIATISTIVLIGIAANSKPEEEG